MNPQCAPAIRRGLVILLLIAGSLPAQDSGTPAAKRAELAVAVTPDVSGLEESAAILVTLTNQNPASDAQLLPGDVFRLVFDLGNGRIESVGRKRHERVFTYRISVIVLGPLPLSNAILPGRPAEIIRGGRTRTEEGPQWDEHDYWPVDW